MDDFRIRASLPTLRYLLAGHCKVVVVSKIGRPKNPNPALSMKPVAKRLAELLQLPFLEAPSSVYPGRHVVFLSDDVALPGLPEKIAALKESVIVLENIRFYPEEQESSEIFAAALARLGDVYVGDSFGVAHRTDTSVSVLPMYLPHFAGLLMESEIRNLNIVLNSPRPPFLLMMGGGKISEKTGIIERLGRTATTIAVGGGIANVFFAALGYEVGKSLVELEGIETAKHMLKEFKSKLLLPTDVAVLADSGTPATRAAYQVLPGDTILDIGPQTILRLSGVIKKARTIVWNGPLGMCERKPFQTGTMAVAKVVGGVGKRTCFTVVGGGETVEAVRQAGQENHIDHLSTGGGAMLEYLSGKVLPGIKALE